MIINNIPIYIISYNRLDCLKQQIAYFEKCGLTNIHIIDNASTYPPLLKYLKTVPHTVHYLTKNYGHEVLFKCADFKNIVDNEYFAYTDSDIIPIDECPTNFMGIFLDILQKNSKVAKVGFSLKIDDLPDFYALKQNVIDWEKRFYQNNQTYQDIIIYDAPIDTTFALYRPRKQWYKNNFSRAFRVGYPYQARHLPWYKDLNKLTQEDIFYNNLDKGIGNWNGTLTAKELTEKYSYKERQCFEINLFFFIPFFTLQQKGDMMRIKLFNFIPLGKIKIKGQ